MARKQEPDRPQIKLDGHVIHLAGSWTSVTLVRALAQIPRRIPPRGLLTIDLAGVSALDTAGAWFIQRSVRNLRHDGRQVEFANLNANASSLLELVSEQTDPRDVKLVHPHFTILHRTGYATIQLGEVLVSYLGFMGETAERWVRIVGNTRRWRIPQFFGIVEETGVTAVPIIALLSFLIGVVIAYEGLFVLRSYGASLFVVNLAGVTVLRELGPLIAAIVVAGRTGSAFAAQIGTMKVSEEVDAMVAMGLSPAEILVLPRIFGLMLALPLLTVLADLAGLVGALVTASLVSGISAHAFFAQLASAVSPATVLAGLAKTPVFALVIATVGCFHGFKAESSAESVGARTTRSVVQSIFFVIVIDAVFAVAYSSLGI
ncbi:MAG TPA: MlaE family lipid ABC transporter permease subunit [Gammaproteobacteria bacterium]|nr:MlaE family lipid ABC transporter permease subunit [Gammaproteobacteria bacterium]